MKINCAHTELVDLHKLQPNPKNPNKHPDRQIKMLAKIIDYQGQRSPIVVSKRSGFITKGHGRLSAIQMLGWEKAAVDFQDYENEAQEYSDIIADNKISELAETDTLMLQEIAVELGDDFDHELLGLGEEIVVPDVSKDEIEDNVPEIAQSISKLGDLYELGEHRLMCGDSTDKKTVEKLMEGDKADMVFTDPPYRQNGDHAESATGFAYRPGFQNLIKSGLNGFDPSNFFQTLTALKCSSIYAFCSKDLLVDYIEYFRSQKRSWDLLVMNKNNPIPMKNNKFLGDIEWLFFSRSEGATFNMDEEYEYYFKCRAVNCKKSEFGHPTEKQVGFVSPYIKISSPISGLIVDLFGGSGSTLIACEKTKRKCFMMELDPHYVDVIVSRWCKYTGKCDVKRNGEPMNWLMV